MKLPQSSAISVWFSWSLLLERAPRVLYFSQPRVSASRHSYKKPRTSYLFPSSQNGNIRTWQPNYNQIQHDSGLQSTSSFALMSWYYSLGTTAQRTPSKKLSIGWQKSISSVAGFNTLKYNAYLWKGIKKKFVCWDLPSSCEKEINNTHTYLIFIS